MTAIIVSFALGYLAGALSAGFLGLYVAMTGTGHDYWDADEYPPQVGECPDDPHGSL